MKSNTVTITANGDYGFCVYLLSPPDRSGMCAANCKGIFKTHAEAKTEAERVGNLYGAPVIDKTITP
jgi:hypothetical protein